jgi:hypothetical protein
LLVHEIVVPLLRHTWQMHSKPSGQVLLLMQVNCPSPMLGE